MSKSNTEHLIKILDEAKDFAIAANNEYKILKQKTAEGKKEAEKKVTESYDKNIETSLGTVSYRVKGSLTLHQIMDRLQELLEDKQTLGGEMRVLKVLNFIK